MAAAHARHVAVLDEAIAAHGGMVFRTVGDAICAAFEIVRKPRRWVRWPATSEPPPMPAGFQVLPRRWVVERTFAWLGRHRRPSQYYKALAETEDA